MADSVARAQGASWRVSGAPEATGGHVRCGVVLPFHAAVPGGAFGDIAQAARCAEQVGLDSVWVGDHLTTGNPLLDSTVALACAAAVTQRVKVGYAVMLPALRPPVWAAKQIASLQYISNDRLLLGVGIGGGGSPDEWEAAGMTSRGRARRTDQFLDVLPQLLGGAPTVVPSLPGCPTVALDPPVSLPEIWIGGTSDAALARAVTYGHGWLSALLGSNELVRQITRLDRLARANGSATPHVGTMLFAHLTEGRISDPSSPVREFLVNSYGLEPALASAVSVGGSPEQVADVLAGLVSAGVTELVIVPFGPDLTAQYHLIGQARSILVAGDQVLT